MKIQLNINGLNSDNIRRKLIKELSTEIKKQLIPLISKSLHDNLEDNVYGLTIKSQTVARKKRGNWRLEPYIRTGQMVNAFLNTNSYKIAGEDNDIQISIDNSAINSYKINNRNMKRINDDPAVISLEANKSEIITKLQSILSKIDYKRIFRDG